MEKKYKIQKINDEFFKLLKLFSGQALHAKSLGFIHPTKNKWVNFESELPEDFEKMLNYLQILVVE